MFSDLLLKRSVEELRVYYFVGGFVSWAESDLISVSERQRTEAHSYTPQPS